MIIIGTSKISIEDVLQVASHGAGVALSTDQGWRASVERSVSFLESQWRAGHTIYGVTTGYGNSCDVSIPLPLVEELPAHLVRYHGCGLGNYLSPQAARAVLLVRLTSLARGYSGVRLCLLERICDLLNHNLLPLIPEEGSVGASGDLTPLSYLAAMLIGERDALYEGSRAPARDCMARLGLEALTLRPKEALAIMNGTSVMTALACLAFDRALYFAKIASLLTAGVAAVLRSNAGHFSERLFDAKPHPGQQQAAAYIRRALGPCQSDSTARLQAPYSLRCAPHVLGVLFDALPWMRATIEIEINSANDNPLIDLEQQTFLHGGHFYGGHIAFAMDSLKALVASCADLLDRQLSLLVDTRTNGGLPGNLSGASGARAAINHGFKAVQIAVSAWTAEALKLTMPASVFSRSTECHNQDKVSMGTIAARDCLRVLELTEQVSAGLLLAVLQALRLRVRAKELQPAQLSSLLSNLVASNDEVPFVEEDRALEQDLRLIISKLRNLVWEL